VLKEEQKHPNPSNAQVDVGNNEMKTEQAAKVTTSSAAMMT